MAARQALLRNEARALAPIGVAGLVTMAAAAVAPTGLGAVGLMAYSITSVAIGAAIVGHETTHRTLGVLLMQPVDRTRVLAAKYLVAVPWLVVLGLAAGGLGLLDGFEPGRGLAPFEIQAVVFALSAGLAPCLTMVTRHVMAGTVGALSVPLVAAGAFGLFGVFETGDPIWFRALAWSLLGVSGAGALLGAVWFSGRLEDLSGLGTPIDFRFGATAATGRLRRLVRLVDKELRLQQLPLVLAGLYVVASLLAWWLPDSWFPAFLDPRQLHLVGFYGGSLALLIGAVASAEERQLGTMPWQLNVAVPAWQQFLIKTVVALVLSVLLAGTIPVALLGSGQVDVDRFVTWLPGYLALIVALTVVGLYVSTVSASSLKAFLVSLPVVAGGLAVATLMAMVAEPLARAVVGALPLSVTGWLPEPQRWSARREEALLITTAAILAPGLVALIWRFALGNHQAADGGGRRVLRQGTAVASYVLVGVLSFELAAAAGSRPYFTGLISGVVVDQAGRPVPGVEVSALGLRTVFGRRVPRYRQQITDAEGRFRLGGLAPEPTYLMVTSGPLAGPQAPAGYAPTFYPDTTNIDVATPIDVDVREMTPDVTITLASAPSTTVMGRVVSADGARQDGLGVQVWLRNTGSEVLPWLGTAGAAVEDGRFTLGALPPGTYLLVAEGPWQNDVFKPRWWGWTEFDLVGEALVDLDVVVHPGSFVRGRMTFDGSAPRPAPRSVKIGVLQADSAPRPSWGNRGITMMRDDWSFELGPSSGAVVPRVSFGAWSVKTVRRHGRDITDEPLETGVGHDIEDVEIVMTDAGASLTADVRDRRGRQAERYAVIVFGADPARRPFPFRFLHSAHSWGSSSVKLSGLPAGEYLAVAVSSLGLDEPWSIEFLSEMAPLATPFTVDWGDERSIELTIVR